MTAEPLISVIVPVYNAQDYLRYCVDSILTQSHTNFELILVDDGATDDSPHICDEYAAQDSRVHVIHQENGGIAKAQNTGLDAAAGDYIAFADNDDILDRHNLEYLLHALETTGADMSKARWRQFGVSQLDKIAEEARQGAPAPTKVTVFKHPLAAYQTVFCKSLRLIGDKLGRNTEARYFNEANWCRLYRRELWDGLRFPEGMYAQDTAVAGQLYIRMDTVADINLSLYNWLQRPDSVTHKMMSVGFFHDHVVAASQNFQLCLENGVTPKRSYYTLTTSIIDEAVATDCSAKTNLAIYEKDQTECSAQLERLSLPQLLACEIMKKIRLLEKKVYDVKIKNMS